MAIEDTYGGENGGSIRKLGNFLRTFGKNVRQFDFTGLIGGGHGIAGSIVGVFEFIGGKFTQSADFLSNIPVIGNVAAGIKDATFAVFTALGNSLLVVDSLTRGNFRDATKEFISGTVETGIEAISGITKGTDISGVSRALWFANIPLAAATGKYISTHAHDMTADIVERVIGSDQQQGQAMKEHFPGMNMASLSTNQAALAMTPSLAAVQPQIRTQPAPGYTPTYWTDRRANELGMDPAMLAKRQGMSALHEAREARNAEMMQEQAV